MKRLYLWMGELFMLCKLRKNEIGCANKLDALERDVTIFKSRRKYFHVGLRITFILSTDLKTVTSHTIAREY